MTAPERRGAGILRRAAAAPFFHLGRVRERRKDWPGAERAYTAAVVLNPANAASYSRRAFVLVKQGRLDDAIADCKAVAGVVPPRKLLGPLADSYRHDRNLTSAIAVLERGLGERPTGALWAALADCRTEMGAFSAAHHAYVEALGLSPDNVSVIARRGSLSAQRSVIPFEVRDGTLTEISAAERRAALDDSVEQLTEVLRLGATRTRAAYELGRVLESHGRLAEARDAYAEAVARVEAVDKPWAHRAGQAWSFRRAYVEHRITGEPSSDDRINRTLELGPPAPDLGDAAGFFEASVAHEGLTLDGFVLHDYRGGITIRVNGRAVLTIAGNKAWNRAFKTTIVNNVVQEFPARSELTMVVGDSHLVTRGGARSVEVIVPDGSGRLDASLDSGRAVTKKGRWSDATIHTGAGDDVYLSAYTTARRFFADELGIYLFLSYGTLLGCYRDGRLIPGDDDFDVSYVSEATGPEELKRECNGLIRALLRGGFDSRVAVDGRLFHLRVGDVVLDVNPFWFANGRAWAFDAHDLSRDVFDPVATTTLNGIEVYIPSDTEAFLRENYGADWRTPRSDFQYYRDKADQAVLREARLNPSEVRELRAYAEELRSEQPSAGRFHGYGDPTDPRFHDDDTAVVG